MGHTVGDQANRAVAKSEKKAAEAKRTPEQRLAAIRGSLTAKLFVIPDDVRFLMERYDELLVIAQAAAGVVSAQIVEIQVLNAQIEQFRSVYEQENRSVVVKVERGPDLLQWGVSPALDGVPVVLMGGDVHPHEIHRFEDDGGPVFVEHGGEA